MKGFLIILILIFTSKIIAQDCILDSSVTKYYKNYYSDASTKAIKENWNDFFGENLDAELPINYRTLKSFPLKFDGLGCIYPDFIDENFRDTFINKSHNVKLTDKNSFYEVYFSGLKRKEKLVSILEANNMDELLIELAKIKQHNNDKHGSFNYESFFTFAKVWNKFLLTKKIEQLNKIISSQNIENIIFFIHGYNVPYGLAKIQNNLIAEKTYEITNDEVQIKKTLFIPVFWSSGDRKDLFQSTNSLKFANQEDLKTTFIYTYISNRAYMAAVGLRQVLNQTKEVNCVKIITHSHGATLATTALISTTSKLQNNDIKELLGTYINKYDLPDKKISIYLNAPAIPGISTFIDIDNITIQKKYFWNIGYNKHDKTLLKKKIPYKVFRLLKFSRLLSSTSLGCDRRKEIRKTKSVFAGKGIKDNFIPEIAGKQDAHDFFCYMMQPEFQVIFEKFIKKSN